MNNFWNIKLKRDSPKFLSNDSIIIIRWRFYFNTACAIRVHAHTKTAFELYQLLVFGQTDRYRSLFMVKIHAFQQITMNSLLFITGARGTRFMQTHQFNFSKKKMLPNFFFNKYYRGYEFGKLW